MNSQAMLFVFSNNADVAYFGHIPKSPKINNDYPYFIQQFLCQALISVLSPFEWHKTYTTHRMIQASAFYW